MSKISNDITEEYIRKISNFKRNLICEIFESENIEYPKIDKNTQINYKNYTHSINPGINKNNSEEINNLLFTTSWYDINENFDEEGGNFSSSLFTGGGFSGLVTNPKMKLVLMDVDHMDSQKLGKNYKLKMNDYHGCCTSGPTTWYKRAGLYLSWWNTSRVVTYKNTIKNLNAGFIPVAHGTSEWIDSLNELTLRPGDIATLYTGKLKHQHGIMWTGTDWRSDCIQKKANPYGNSSNPWFAVLWRHPDFQEPGQTVTQMIDA